MRSACRAMREVCVSAGFRSKDADDKRWAEAAWLAGVGATDAK